MAGNARMGKTRQVLVGERDPVDRVGEVAEARTEHEAYGRRLVPRAVADQAREVVSAP